MDMLGLAQFVAWGHDTVYPGAYSISLGQDDLLPL